MLIWPVLALLLVLLFYKRDVTPPWNPVIQPPQPWPPQPPQPSPQPPQAGAPTTQPTSGFSGTFVSNPPPIDLNDVFRRPRT